MREQLVIVGASYAGVQLAASMRDVGFDGSIVLVGEELHAPYHRPPLSKGFLTGKSATHSLPLKGPKFFEEGQIEFRSGKQVVKIDRVGSQILLDNGERIPYDKLGITTGARCRQLTCDGANLSGIHYLRSMNDSIALLSAAKSAENVVVIGGGFIGLEVTASLRSQGKHVTVIDSTSRLMSRVAHPIISELLYDVHSSRGVNIHLDVEVARISGHSNKACGVELKDGRSIPCDMVVVGIGVVPNDELAADSGLAVNNGILVNEFGRTTDPNIVAAGDCARYPNPWAGELPIRLESVQSANDLAKTAASYLIGRHEPYKALPWFWSDQYSYKLQMAGISIGWDRVSVRGVPRDGIFSVFYFREDQLIAVDSVNQPREHMTAKKLLLAGCHPKDAQVTDVTFDLSTLLNKSATTAMSLHTTQ